MYSNRAKGRRRFHFDVCKSQQSKNRKALFEKMNELEQFSDKIGLKIDQVILSPLNNLRPRTKSKLTILQNEITKRNKTFIWMKIKDQTNLSDKKYKICCKMSKEVNPIKMPSLFLLKQMQKNLNNFFKIQIINYNSVLRDDFPKERGAYVDPVHKINFVCQKFIRENEDFNENIIRIRLSADSTQISKRKKKVLNFTFDLMDDLKNISSVSSIYILGNILS